MRLCKIVWIHKARRCRWQKIRPVGKNRNYYRSGQRFQFPVAASGRRTTDVTIWISDDLNRIAVSIKGNDAQATLTRLRKTWDQVAPQRPFMYHFLDESFSAQYEADQHFGQLFTFFSYLAICIACLGLFGLSTFMAQQRVKEIGVRKVLGSSISGIVMLLSKDFIKLILIAIVIATPLCLWAMNLWLQGFAYRITIGPLVFVEAGMISLIIALLTMAWQSVKAATSNPVNSLRNE